MSNKLAQDRLSDEQKAFNRDTLADLKKDFRLIWELPLEFKTICLDLLQRTDWADLTVTSTHKQLAIVCCCSIKHAGRFVRAMLEIGLFTCLRKGNNMNNSPSLYKVVTDHPLWTGDQNEIKKALFTIIRKTHITGELTPEKRAKIIERVKKRSDDYVFQIVNEGTRYAQSQEGNEGTRYARGNEVRTTRERGTHNEGTTSPPSSFLLPVSLPLSYKEEIGDNNRVKSLDELTDDERMDLIMLPGWRENNNPLTEGKKDE